MDQDHGCHAVRTGLGESGGAVEGSPSDPSPPTSVSHHWQHHCSGKEGKCEPDETMPPCSLVLLPNLGATGAFLVWAQRNSNSNSPLRKAWLDSGKTREQGGPVDVGVGVRVIPRCPVRQGGHTQMSSNRVEASLILVPIAHPPVSERLRAPCLFGLVTAGAVWAARSLASSQSLFNSTLAPKKKQAPPARLARTRLSGDRGNLRPSP